MTTIKPNYVNSDIFTTHCSKCCAAVKFFTPQGVSAMSMVLTWERTTGRLCKKCYLAKAHSAP